MVRAISAVKVKRSRVRKVKVRKVKAKARPKANSKARNRGRVPVPPPPAPYQAPPAQTFFNLPNQLIRSSGNEFNVSHYIEYYESVTGKRQQYLSAVQNRAAFNSLNADQQAFLTKYGGPNSALWNSQGQTSLLVSQEVNAFDLNERRRLKVPFGLQLDNTRYQQALASYNRISDKGLIGSIVEKIQNFSNAFNNLIRSFGAAASGVIKQLMDGLQNIMAAFFPSQLDTMDIRQGYVGNCYLLAGINALGENGDAETQKMLRDAVEFNEDGSIKVTFAGLGVQDWDDRGNPVYKSYTVRPEALRWFEQNDRFSRGSTPLGVRAIEVAYGMHRAGLNSLNGVDQYNQAQQALWGGTLHEGIQALTGLSSHYFSSSNTSAAQFAAHFSNPKAQAITAATGSNPVSPLVPTHAYTVTAYDPVTNRVTVENPWYTSQPLQISATAFDYYAVTVKP